MRLSIQFAIVLMALNAVGAVYAGSGMADATPISGPAGSSEIDQFESDAQDRPEFGGGALQTLFGMYVTAADFINGLFGYLTAGPAMLKSSIFPAWIIDPLTGLVYAFIALDLIYVATGRSP